MSSLLTNDRVTRYAREVVAEKIPSGEYYYNPDKANEIIAFAESLTIAEGDKPKALTLLDSQAFDLGCTFGWYKTSNNKRRFRRRYKSMARQNGKTFENGIIGTYIAGFGGYNYGKLFTVATKKRQARLAWEEMSKFITIDDELGDYFEIKDYKSTVLALNTNCTIEALSREAGLEDGFRSIYSSIDEIHQHRDNKIYKALYNGTRALPETLVSMITTRGDNLNSFCKEMDDYCINILQGGVTADDFFVDIYCLDPTDDIWDPENWKKANPFISADAERFETLKVDAQTAKDMGGSDLRDFITKCHKVKHYEEMENNRTLEDFRGKSCYVGLDLSSGGDLTTYSLEFAEPYVNEAQEQKEKYFIYSHSFMPRGRLEEHIATDLAPYDLWEQMELITVTGGATDYKNDYKFIIKHLKEIKEEYDLTFLGIGIDPHNADGILADLEEFGCPVVIITQSARYLNDATIDMQLLVKSGDIEYNKNDELLSWSFLNARIVRNSFDEIKVDKKPNSRCARIDPVDATIDAHACRLKNKQSVIVNIDSEMDRYLKAMGWKTDN